MSVTLPNARECTQPTRCPVKSINSFQASSAGNDHMPQEVATSKIRDNFDPSDIESNRKFLNRVGIDPRLLIVNSIFAMAAMPQIAADFGKLERYDPRIAMQRFNRTKDFFLGVLQDPSSTEALDTFAQVKNLHEKLGVNAHDPQFQYVVFALTYRLMEPLHRLNITPPTNAEEVAWFKVWREAARLLGASITDDYAKFIEDNKKLEEQYWLGVEPQSHEVAHKLLERGLSYLSPPIQPLAKRIILALIDPELVQAFELQKLSTLERISVGQILRNSSLLSKLLQEFSH